MSRFLQTIDLLKASGFPLHYVQLSTVDHWLAQGYSPTRIATEIYAVKPRPEKGAEG